MPQSFSEANDCKEKDNECFKKNVPKVENNTKNSSSIEKLQSYVFSENSKNQT